MEFKDRIRELRKSSDMSAFQLADLLDKTVGAVRMWETGRSKPDADTLIKLAQHFSCTTDYLLGLSDIKNKIEEYRIKNQLNDIITNFQIKDTFDKELIVSLIQTILSLGDHLKNVGISDLSDLYKLFIEMFNIINTRYEDVSVILKGYDEIDNRNVGVQYNDHYINILVADNNFCYQRAMAYIIRILDFICDKAKTVLIFELEKLSWSDSEVDPYDIVFKDKFISILTKIEEERNTIKQQQIKRDTENG